MTLRKARALFPVTVAGADCKLNRLDVIAYPTQHGGRKSCPSGKSEEVKRLLGHARYGEGIETVDIDVVVHIDDPEFDDRSYGLALAIADKQARFGARGGFDTIVATGVIDNRGAVSRIEAFPEKLALVLESQAPGTLFVFPTANRHDADSRLDALTARRITWRAVTSIDELDKLWQAPTTADRNTDPVATWTKAPPIRTAGRLLPFAKGLALGFMLVAGSAALVAYLQPG